VKLRNPSGLIVEVDPGEVDYWLTQPGFERVHERPVKEGRRRFGRRLPVRIALVAPVQRLLSMPSSARKFLGGLEPWTGACGTDGMPDSAVDASFHVTESSVRGMANQLREKLQEWKADLLFCDESVTGQLIDLLKRCGLGIRFYRLRQCGAAVNL